ncbi:MAG: hypothetical protein Q9M35_11645 [Rhodothermus sp.]|nr:hypothetical protein [Rhodothermus sp.]
MRVLRRILFAGLAAMALLLSGAQFTGRITTQAACASGGTCTDAGCIGGWIPCYIPPDGGLCLTERTNPR